MSFSTIAGNALITAGEGLARGFGFSGDITSLHIDPAILMAAKDPGEALGDIMQLISRGIVVMGAIMVAFGLVTIGMNLARPGGGGADVSQGIAAAVGGAVVIAAGTYLGTLSTDI